MGFLKLNCWLSYQSYGDVTENNYDQRMRRTDASKYGFANMDSNSERAAAHLGPYVCDRMPDT